MSHGERIDVDVSRSAPVRITVDGESIDAFEGESVAAALIAAGTGGTRTSIRRADPRGYFCGMGVCWECGVRIDGRYRRACMVRVEDGMRVETTRAAHR